MRIEILKLFEGACVPQHMLGDPQEHHDEDSAEEYRRWKSDRLGPGHENRSEQKRSLPPPQRQQTPQPRKDIVEPQQLPKMDTKPSSELKPIKRFIGVYNASGTVWGELSYFVGARFGRAHCALCTITHGLTSEKEEFQVCKRKLKMKFDTYHNNDQPDLVRKVSEALPLVGAETDDGFVLLLGPDELEKCQSSLEAMMEAMKKRSIELGLEWQD